VSKIIEALEEVKKKAKTHALDVALSSRMTVIPDLSRDVPQVFGDRWAAGIDRTKSRLSVEYGDKLVALIRYSQRYYVYACEEESTFMRLMFELEGGVTNDLQKQLITPDGYADSEGWAYTLYNTLAELNKPPELLSNLGFVDFPNWRHCLDAMAVCWFFDAALRYKESQVEAFDLLFEVSDAMVLSNGQYMWEASEELQITAFREAGRLGSKKRHAPMAALRKWTIEKYQAGTWKSANQAAFIMKNEVIAYGRTIGAHLSEENAQRTIGEWIRSV